MRSEIHCEEERSWEVRTLEEKQGRGKKFVKQKENLDREQENDIKHEEQSEGVIRRKKDSLEKMR